MAQFTMVAIAIDRLIAVAFPLWFKQRANNRYLAIIISFIFGYGIYDLTLRFIDYTYTKEIGLLMAAYSLCWFMVFKLPTVSQDVEEWNRKLIKALCFIIALNLIGVFVRVSVDLVFQAYAIVDVFIRTPYSIVSSFFTIIVYSADGPLLYIVSIEYRTRLNQQFPWLTKIFGPIERNIIQVTPSSMHLQQQQRRERTV
ncbi:hypothetical protein niasHS_004925 [Heterodera schachtii]|uniref:G-protein coupled receptors family 1 profile domain-containing protein n=1 Tax=Heterodera schachtii TaxID=97005 RepID=A0ABD2K060_HETSC